MKYENIFDEYEIDYDKLLDYGFIKNGDNYVLAIDLNEEFYVRFIISECLEVNVYEKEDDTLFIPFNLKEVEGEFINKIRNEVTYLVLDIIEKCFNKLDISDDICEYIKDKYHPVVDNPFKKYSEYTVFKKDNKWFGLLMRIDYDKLIFGKEGKVNVINLKLKPERISMVIDNKNIFKAYHMNKKHWVSILLNKNIDIELLKDLIDESYNLI